VADRLNLTSLFVEKSDSWNEDENQYQIKTQPCDNWTMEVFESSSLVHIVLRPRIHPFAAV